MPKIFFGQNHRIIGAAFTGKMPKWDFVDILDEAYEQRNERNGWTDEVVSPFIPEEEWYISGIKYPQLIAIDSRSCEKPVAPWKMRFNQEYGHRIAEYYKMYTKSLCKR